MKFMSVHVVDGALDEYSETLRMWRAKLDRMFNQGEVALASAVLAAYGRFQHAIGHHGTFDLRTREAIALVVAAMQDCRDCHFTRTVACHAAGWTREQTFALRTGEQIAYEEKIIALLAVARQAADHTCEVSEDSWQRALWIGWTTEELAELFTHVIANIFSNSFNHGARIEADTSAVPGLKEAVA